MNATKLPFMKFYVDDYLADTVRLSTFEHGCYLLLIVEYWRNQGPIPDDIDELSEICRCDPEQLEKIKKKLLKYFKIVDGFWVHSRIEREMKDSRDAYEKRRKAGAKGGKAKAKQSASNAKAMLKQPEPEPEPEPNNINNNIIAEYSKIFVTELNGYVQPIQNLSQEAKDNLVDIHCELLRSDFEVWRDVCKKVKENPYYLGENNTGWVINLDWFADAKKVIRVLNQGSGKPKPQEPEKEEDEVDYSKMLKELRAKAKAEGRL